MEEVVLRLEKLLFPAIADVAVLSVNVDIEIVRVDAQCTTARATCPGCGSWSTQVTAPTCGFPPTCRALDEASFSSFGFVGSGAARHVSAPDLRRANTRPDAQAWAAH
ncbi:hypothetical protein ACIP6X_43555 [Streptomyces coeruleorubidus]|uniref:hypothetical protein n=1 Tax=Streptomyces coeruleorubidus TaxID=116188 RepID=UPI00382DB5A2